ncbi:unnamed protein product [Effrenium voratum]|nr:unnamed protein product [Effrenium voratum]
MDTPSLLPHFPGFQSFRPDVLLPDYDCSHVREQWEELFTFTESLKSRDSSTPETWIEFIEKWAPIPWWQEGECPFMSFITRLFLWTACYLLVKHPHGIHFRGRAQVVWLLRQFALLLSREILGLSGQHYGLRPWEELPIFLNSRWAWLFSDWVSHLRGAHVRDARLDCPTPKGGWASGWDWKHHLERLLDGQLGFNYSQGTAAAVAWSLHPEVFADVEGKGKECPLGLLTVMLQQAVVYLRSMTEQVPIFMQTIAVFASRLEEELGDELLPSLLRTSWPALDILAYAAQVVQWRRPDGKFTYQTKPFRLDFAASELLTPLEERIRLEELASRGSLVLPLLHLRRTRGSATFRAVGRALGSTLRARLARPGGHHLVIFTMVYGKRLAQYLPAWLQRMRAFGHGGRTLVFCLDETSEEACRRCHEPLLCVRGREQTAANKFHMMSVIVNDGFDVLYLDFDVVLLQDPVPPVLKAAEQAELLVSRDLGSECLNIGVLYLKAHPDVAAFLQELIIWLWNHPYEFCQKAFAGLLGVEDLHWNEMFGDLGKAPRWAILDPVNAFVSSIVYSGDVQGWTGDLENIIIYHFLDASGAVDTKFAVAGRYVNLFDLFYANPKLDLADATTPLFQQDPQVQDELLGSRLPAAPSVSVWAL